MTTPWDALVLGGGPGGSAASIALACAGLRVAVLERSGYDAPRIGETLPPSVAPLLHRLGAWEAFVRDGHLPSPGVVSVWGDAEPYENDFIFNPYGNGRPVQLHQEPAPLSLKPVRLGGHDSRQEVRGLGVVGNLAAVVGLHQFQRPSGADAEGADGDEQQAEEAGARQ